MSWTEERRREAGHIQLKVRVRRATCDQLADICDHLGETRGEVIARLVEREWRESCEV